MHAVADPGFENGWSALIHNFKNNRVLFLLNNHFEKKGKADLNPSLILVCSTT